jgi:serine/threonine protein kinase
MSSLIGQSLGRYQILEQLGEGGMAKVFKAHDDRLDRFVAIKVIRIDQFAPSMLEEMLRRFEREARALAQLSYPNIVHVYDFGEYEGAPYLVMEYLSGGTLKLRSDTPMPWQKALKIILPISQALASAHEHNIIHRDIKPGNILLTEKGQPMLSDFGIAKILESNEAGTLTGTGMGIGTPEYMAPEQWTGQSGPKSDIYSLGVVLYELVTGRKPYTADTPVGVMLKQVKEPLPHPRQFVPDLPLELENVILKALERQPEDRYQNMAEFTAALEALAISQNISVTMKMESTQAAKMSETIGETGLATGLPTISAVDKGKPPAGLGAEIPLPPESPRKPSFSRRRWLPITVVTALLVLGLVLGGGFLIRGFKGLFHLGTTTVLAKSTGDVKVLWDVSHDPRTAQDGSRYTPDGMYKSLAQALASENYAISNDDLTNLNSSQILVLSALSGTLPYTNDEVDKIEQFVRVSGHGLLILSDTPGLENLLDNVTRRFSISLGESISNGPVSISNESFFSGVTSLQFLSGGGILQVSSPSQSAAADQDGNSVVAFCECDAGRVMVISDGNLWDNQGISQANNLNFAANVFKWLAKSSP